MIHNDLEDIFTVAAVMMTLQFDHCIPNLKHSANPDHDYLTRVYWNQAPMLLEFNMEKLSGCFVHWPCHKKDQ